MASATLKSQKRLAEFLKEQQEPFTLEVYLLERGYSQKWNSKSKLDSHKSIERSVSTCLNRKIKSLSPIFKVLSTLHRKISCHNKSSIVTKDSSNRSEHVCISNEACSFDLKVVETERFSCSTSSTVFLSCSDIDEDETSLLAHSDKPQFSPDTCRVSTLCNIEVQSQHGNHHQICIEGSTFPLTQYQNNRTLNHDVSGKEKRIHSCGVVAPKKITEESLLSTALWSLLTHSTKKENYSMDLRENLGSNVSKILKSKRVLHKTKQLLFDCVREITITLPRKDYGQGGNKIFMGPEELGNIICQRTKEWSKKGAGDETNLTHLLTLDYLNSINEWSKFEQHVKDVSIEIADAILECVNDEIVSDMIEILAPINHYNKLQF
ncbi:PREDICTED: uncharacterized protein LOC109343846 isoform X2 [Lupinus angustifolius]|uniref:uncharacterized protein LOC109343846 isoform X2 n=1 Tax=Lupinus angustifolius TaxID=3871 RepID=UPI00092E6D6E|nr:PREDICTED: uncharacterized protein LOC109343846 isoform X2 [Lupinus angustifolius]